MSPLGKMTSISSCSPVTGRPPTLPTDVRDAEDAEGAACGDITAGSMFTGEQERESKAYTEKRISFQSFFCGTGL